MSNAVAIPMRTCIYTSANVFDLLPRLPSSLLLGGLLVDPAQCHAAQFPLHALARFQYASIRGQEHALSRMGQSLHIGCLPRPCDLPQILAGQPYPPRRLAHQLHVLEHRLVVPVLEAQPQSPPGRVLRDLDVVEYLFAAQQSA